MPQWRVEQLRLTAFLPTDLRQPPPAWWREVAGGEPPSQSSQQGLFVQHSGPFRGNYCQLAMEIKVGRIDWSFSTIPSEGVPTGFPSFDDVRPGFQTYRDVVLPWIAGKENVRRLAVGTVLMASTPDRLAGYRELQPLLPDLRLDVERSSDLFYQINRHATSTAVSGLHLNRLSNWGVVMGSMTHLQITPGAPPVVVAGNEGAFSAVRLQMDINSDAERADPLPSGTIRELCEEMIVFAEQIADRGDVR